ncbi:hypothetical protein DPMN_148252 [Dreissena polymorpha]|uniref:Uncharacterized protein n=1 Tax=Dreissena polymorpha TaxID=45954 RepID=A0A9D4FBH9_DREPO|nr:hypothetical protein DPMN_148252 [Dreissena polymorpha]
MFVEDGHVNNISPIKLVWSFIIHSLGSYNDQTTACPAGRNVMSAYLFSPDASTSDTYSRFSTCSANQFLAHLNG